MHTHALAAIRRTNQARCEQVCEGAALTCGMAYYSRRFPDIPAANAIRDLTLSPGVSPHSVHDEVRACFAEKGLRCCQWVPALDQPAEALDEVLTSRGYESVTMRVMILPHDVESPAAGVPHADPQLRILPARAVRAAFREIVLGDPQYPPEIREQAADLAAERMDDPQYDMYVATLDGRPVGHGGLLQVGDIGRIDELFVLQAHRGKNIGAALMAYLVAMSRRLALRTTVLELPAGSPAERLCERFGFDPAGDYVQWVTQGPGHV